MLQILPQRIKAPPNSLALTGLPMDHPAETMTTLLPAP